MGLLSLLGRRPLEVTYSNVHYNDKEYVVCSIYHNDTIIKTVIDKEDLEEVKKYSWHVSGRYYIGTNINIDGKIKELYLHNFVMNVELFGGKGQKTTVDHINRNGFDNRKENLRIISQSLQNINQKKKERKITLPENVGINVNDIPKHIYYSKPNGAHGDRFVIEFKSEKIVWKGTSSKTVSLIDKLKQAKEKLNEFYNIYPYLHPDYEKTKIDTLNKEYEEIIATLP